MGRSVLLVRPILGLIAFAIVALSTFSATAVGGSDERTVGLFLNEPGALDGYTLFAPLNSMTTYLIDNDGMAVHSWESEYEPGAIAFLLENGHLLRAAAIESDIFTAGGHGGRIEEFDWEGNLVWQYEYATDEYFAHHDIEPMPNGNVLILAWDRRTQGEAIEAGRDPGLLEDGELWSEKVVEVRPEGMSGGEIVWEWELWDHLIQDEDYFQANYGTVADNPQLVDVNYFNGSRPSGGEDDWIHANAIDYNAELDQVMISARHFDELWVIDHSTTTEQAASHAGGNSGMGGDIIYRWGNPEAYDRGGPDDRTLFLQHDAHWIPPGLPGTGNILVFNNGNGRTPENYSSVDELVPPVDGFGYGLTPDEAYGPDELEWTYEADPPTDFYSSFVSGAQRLPNGNTLICAGALGEIREVTDDDEIVWRYVNPVTDDGKLALGDPIPENGNILFQAFRYASDYPAFDGKELAPLGPIELEKGAVPPSPSPTSDAPTATPTETPAPPTPTAEPGVPGDADGDGNVTSLDALAVLQYSADLVDELPDLQAADVNGDGSISSLDGALILQYAAGLISTLPI